jgi:hypothetical protein
LDWPARQNAQDYPQTDGKRWPTDVTLSIDGVPFKEVAVDNDFADARGVLSHVAQYQHGSCGVLVDAPIEGKALEALKESLTKGRTVTVRFEVKPDAAHVGGLALYGGSMGSWPADPTLVFSLADGAKKPKGEAKAVHHRNVRFETVIKRGPGGQEWQYTTESPGENWRLSEFDDSHWAKGKSGFGVSSAPGARVGTAWSAPDIWLRSKVNAGKGPMMMDLYHGGDVEVFVDGVSLVTRTGSGNEYEHIILTKEQRALFQANATQILAVHCRNCGENPFVDLNLAIER